MLERLDDISWQHLHHAYGTAEDVPKLLRALCRSGTEQEEALSALFGNIWHQGTVYEASSYAVPFLVQVAAEASVPRRDEILGLIGALASGKSYLAVHAQPGHKIGEFFRQKPDFEERLKEELENVRRTRLAVFACRDVLCLLLQDALPMVRAGAAYVLSRFPEHVSEFGSFIRQAVKVERHPLALAGLLWCLGALRDESSEAAALLDRAVRQPTDSRQGFAAAVALYRIRGERHRPALPLYRQLAATTWFAEQFLLGLPWHISEEIRLQPILAGVEPDRAGATCVLLILLDQTDEVTELYPAIVRDLLQINFVRGDWRKCTQLTSTQEDILRRLVETDAAWKDTKRLYFLVPDGAKRILEITSADIEKVRGEMSAILGRSGISA